MSKAALIAFLGLLSALLPFVGIPTIAKTALAVLFGIGILILGFLVHEERRWLLRALKGDHQTNAYTENGSHAYGKSTEEVG
ncbi:MAG: hypothetical protein ACE5F4_01780 [Candidatus Paceibacteria bacterium]